MLEIGILGCAEIAQRMFMPAVQNSENVSCKVVGELYNPVKLEAFRKAFGVEGVSDFEMILQNERLDAVYVPQPPALHYEWGKKALESGKHCFLEKPSTDSFAHTEALVKLAKKKGLVLQENYMFQYHAQLAELRKMLKEGIVGDIRLIKASFGFPLRAQNDFRYNKSLGGGVLLDAAGYVTKLATILLGPSIKVDAAMLRGIDGFEVDMYGSATYSNADGLVCQGSFSMDCYYQCCLEVWGNRGKLFTNRIFTAPPGYEPLATLETAEGSRQIPLPADSHFERSLEMFCSAITDDTLRNKMYDDLLIQADLVEKIRRIGTK